MLDQLLNLFSPTTSATTSQLPNLSSTLSPKMPTNWVEPCTQENHKQLSKENALSLTRNISWAIKFKYNFEISRETKVQIASFARTSQEEHLLNSNHPSDMIVALNYFLRLEEINHGYFEKLSHIQKNFHLYELAIISIILSEKMLNDDSFWLSDYSAYIPKSYAQLYLSNLLEQESLAAVQKGWQIQVNKIYSKAFNQSSKELGYIKRGLHYQFDKAVLQSYIQKKYKQDFISSLINNIEDFSTVDCQTILQLNSSRASRAMVRTAKSQLTGNQRQKLSRKLSPAQMTTAYIILEYASKEVIQDLPKPIGSQLDFLLTRVNETTRLKLSSHATLIGRLSLLETKALLDLNFNLAIYKDLSNLSEIQDSLNQSLNDGQLFNPQSPRSLSLHGITEAEQAPLLANYNKQSISTILAIESITTPTNGFNNNLSSLKHS